MLGQALSCFLVPKIHCSTEVYSNSYLGPRGRSLRRIVVAGMAGRRLSYREPVA